MKARMNLADLPDMFTPNDLQDLMGISRQTVYGLIKSDGFPVLRIGKKILIPKAAYLEWLKQNTQGARDDTWITQLSSKV